MEEKLNIREGLQIAGYTATAAIIIPLTALAGLAFFGGLTAKKYVYNLPRKDLSSLLNPLDPNTSRVFFSREDPDIHVYEIDGKQILVQFFEEAHGPYGLFRSPKAIAHGEIKREGRCYTESDGVYGSRDYFDVGLIDDERARELLDGNERFKSDFKNFESERV